jgi:hypothetical protein
MYAFYVKEAKDSYLKCLYLIFIVRIKYTSRKIGQITRINCTFSLVSLDPMIQQIKLLIRWTQDFVSNADGVFVPKFFFLTKTVLEIIFTFHHWTKLIDCYLFQFLHYYCNKHVLSLTHMLILNVCLTTSLHGLYTSTQHLNETLEPLN